MRPEGLTGEDSGSVLSSLMRIMRISFPSAMRRSMRLCAPNSLLGYTITYASYVDRRGH